MINTKLILFEGIPGSGKTTTSQVLYKYLINNGIKSEVYTEGSEHPIDLPYYAYLSVDEFNELLLQYPLQANWLHQNSIREEEYMLTPYKVPEPHPWNDALVDYLRSKELCYSKKASVTFNTFKNVFYRRFEHFTSIAINKDSITILESVLFQHQIHDIHRLYPLIDDDEIIEYLSELANIIRPLNPVLFYLSQDSVKESLEHTARIRSKPKWSNIEKIKYYIKRKDLELAAVKYISINSVIFNNTDRNWDKMFETILNTLSLVR